MWANVSVSTPRLCAGRDTALLCSGGSHYFPARRDMRERVLAPSPSGVTGERAREIGGEDVWAWCGSMVRVGSV